VPDALHRKLTVRAAESGQTLSDYLRAELGRLAARRLVRAGEVSPERAAEAMADRRDLVEVLLSFERFSVVATMLPRSGRIQEDSGGTLRISSAP
jgi:hypothetical protein